MGASPYFYFTPYQKDIQAALEALREQEFRAGRYDPAMRMADPPLYMFEFNFPPGDASPAPGAQHSSIDEAINAGAESGTRSILDIMRIVDEPDYEAACALSPDELIELFGTATPTRELVETVLIKGGPLDESIRRAGERFWEEIDRGQGRYIIVYDNAGPREIFFVGYSWD
jgi:hypothetical protein